MCACWCDSPAAGVLRAAGRNSRLYHIKINPEASQPHADRGGGGFSPVFCGFNVSAQHRGCWWDWGMLGVGGEHVSPSPASAALPSPQPLEMIILHSPKQIKASPSLPIILMDFTLLFKLRCFQTRIHLNVSL